MNNSQVFLAFALPFSIIPLLMLTNSKKEMGDFKNNFKIITFYKENYGCKGFKAGVDLALF